MKSNHQRTLDFLRDQIAEYQHKERVLVRWHELWMRRHRHGNLIYVSVDDLSRAMKGEEPDDHRAQKLAVEAGLPGASAAFPIRKETT